MPDTLKLRLSLDIEYTLNGVSEQYLRRQLEFIMENAMSNGMVTGESDAEIENWDMRIHRVDSEGESK